MFRLTLVSLLSLLTTVGANNKLANVSDLSLSPKKVMVWMADPYPQPNHKPNPITIKSMIDGLKPHRMAFTGLAYQYFAICGEGSNDVGGSNDCHPADATGAPHLAQGHPILTPKDLGAQLAAALGTGYQGSALELWPTISYGNPGNASVLMKLLTNDTAISQFIADAISIAHKQKLTGFNFDIETGGVDQTKLSSFIQKFGAALHASTPPIKVSFDAGNAPLPNVQDMDRWISMGTYTADTNAYLVDLKGGIKNSGSKFGVGLCPSCNVLSSNAVEARFAGIREYGDVVREIDMWAADYQIPVSPAWQNFWPQIEKWLQSS